MSSAAVAGAAPRPGLREFDLSVLARATLTVIRRNLAWAFGYNIAAIPLAAAGFLNPVIAGAAMAASSAFVVASSVRLRRFGQNNPDGRMNQNSSRAAPGRPVPVARGSRAAPGRPDESEQEPASCPG